MVSQPTRDRGNRPQLFNDLGEVGRLVSFPFILTS